MAKQTTLPTDVSNPQTAETESPTGLNGRLRKAVCPVNPEHGGARVYKTAQRTRYCVCDTCGRTWKQTGARYSQAADWCQELADKLEQEARKSSTIGTREVVVLEVASVRKIAAQLREIASQTEREDVPTPATA